MPKRAFTTRPKEKSEDYHGSCQIEWLPDAYKPGNNPAVPKSLNLDLTFEEALKFGVAIQSCLQSLNRYNRSTKSGRDMGLALSIKFDEQQITVIESDIGS